MSGAEKSGSGGSSGSPREPSIRGVRRLDDNHRELATVTRTLRARNESTCGGGAHQYVHRVYSRTAAERGDRTKRSMLKPGLTSQTA